MNIPSLKQLDLSNNMLEGKIPESLSIFSVDTFKGNEGLCGKPLDKVCSDKSTTNNINNNTKEQPQKKSNNTMLMVVIISIAGLIFIFFALCTLKQRREEEEEEHFGVLDRGKMPDSVVEVHVPSSTRSRMTDTSRKGSSRKSSTHGKNGMTDLIMVNDDKGAFGLPDLMKAAAEVLGNGGLGSAYKAVMANGLSVVVKRLREMNRLQRDGFDAEMRRFGRLSHQNILTPLAYHFRREEKLLVSEYIPKGSLLYVLHGTF